MKREIKFKAKRIDNGKWAIGSLLLLNDQAQIVNHDDNPIVDPNTICQYSGEKDRKGVEIYEGDIILFHFRHRFFPYTFYERHRIYYSDMCKKWMYDNLSRTDTSIEDFAETLSVVKQKGSKSWIDVIGNEYDNPELLEELES